MLVIDIKKAQKMILDRVSCNNFQVQFRKNKRATIQAFINLGDKINPITPAYA